MRVIPAGLARNRVRVLVAPTAQHAALWVAQQTAATITAVRATGRMPVLGLPTGATPIPIYAWLVAQHRARALSFADVVGFNLDEYHPLPRSHGESFGGFIDRHLWSQVDGDARLHHALSGEIEPAAAAAHAADYERAIADAGGVDLCLLGIGSNGHIAFNEPGSTRDSRTRLVWLDRSTRRAAARGFGGEANVPRGGITMGVGTMLAARRIILLACGEGKADAIAAAVEGPASAACPASWLHDHSDVTIVVDPAAASRLSAICQPWLCGPLDWTPALERQAVIASARAAKKPILALTERDHEDQGLHALIAKRGGVHELNLDAFRSLQAVITGWPGGKPGSARRPGDIPRARDAVHPKRVLVFSPHPDDDVIGMGGTVIRLRDQGHTVHVAHCTSGANAVGSEDLLRASETALAIAALAGQQLALPTPNQHRAIGALVRQAEARSAARRCGLPASQVHFLDLPFYERRAAGASGEAALGSDDVARLVALLDTIQPHQIYAAGDLRDPHGTHRLCLELIERACRAVASAPWCAGCECLLYRGAWDAWEAHELAMAVPLAPADVAQKRSAILCHRSQADGALYMGDDQREFWQRAEARSAEAAEALCQLGLPRYVAIEGFAAWRPFAPAEHQGP